MPRVACHNIDRLITVEMRRKGMPRGIISALYDAARETLGGEPLTFLAATRLIEASKRSRPVVICTGFRHATGAPYGETDGPPGAAALARAMTTSFNLPIIVVTEDELVNGTGKVLSAAGLTSLAGTTDTSGIQDVNVVGFTADAALAKDAAKEFLDRVDPCAVITTEKIGANDRGVYHSALGTDISREQAKVDVLVEEARHRAILTISIGDVGNEIGFGLIGDAAKKIVPRGRDCGCPCGGGIIASTAADVVIPCAVSNWGAYGLSAAMAVLMKNSEVAHEAKSEERMVLECLGTGAIDGGTGKPTLGVDGIELTYHQHMVDLLRVLVQVALKEEYIRKF